jgi:hypothetical protein
MIMTNIKKVDWTAYRTLFTRIFLIVLIPALMYFWGLAIIGNIANFWDIFTPVSKGTFKQDLGEEVPVLPPTISALPKAVKDSKLTISGFTQEGMQVEIFLNGDQIALVRSDKNGQFSFDGAALNEGDNEIYVKAKNGLKVESGPSEKITVKYLKKPPFLELTNLGDNADLRQNTNIFALTGKTEPGISVTINGSFVFVDNNGSFSFQLALPDGASLVTAVSTDSAGNQATITRNVTFTKQ